MNKFKSFAAVCTVALCFTGGVFAQPDAAIGVTRDIKRGIVVNMSGDIFFEFNKAELNQSHIPTLDKVADVLVRQSDLKIIVEGHSDNVGSQQQNIRISQERAESVRKHLISRGIVADRLTAVGKGYETPIADNATEQGRAMNRRVELLVEWDEEAFKALTKAVVDTVVVTKVDSVTITKTFIDSVFVTQTKTDTLTIRDTVMIEVVKNVDTDIKLYSARAGLMYSPTPDDLGMARFLEVELGTIAPSGLFVSGVASFGGGSQGKRGNSTGGGLNVGYCFGQNGPLTNIVGGTAGLWNVFQKVEHRGVFSHNENTLSFGGAFWKFMFGKNHNFDITNRLLFGFSEGREYDHATAAYFGSKREFALTHSVNIGYTFAKRKGE